jgi:hypothetical protein
MTPEQVSATEPVFFPGGVADPAGGAGYIADGAGIVAVGLRDGQPLWRTDRAERPLISDGERLAAATAHERLGSALRVVVLATRRQGEPVLVSDPVVLPEWVTVAMERREAFRVSARAVGNRLRLEWEAHARYGGGAPPPAHVRRAAVRGAAGVVEIDLESGVVAPLTTDPEASAPTALRRPPLDAYDLEGPWLAGTAAARLVWGVDDGEQVLVLETSDPSTGDTGAVVELARGQGLVPQVTPDGCHLLLHEEPSPGGDGPWRVFSVKTGRRVATLTHDAGASAPTLLGDRVFYLVERPEDGTARRALRARELGSDTLAWELPLAARRRSIAPRLRQ